MQEACLFFQCCLQRLIKKNVLCIWCALAISFCSPCSLIFAIFLSELCCQSGRLLLFFFFSSCFTKEEGCIQARCDLKIMPWLYTEIQDYLLLPMAAILNNSPSHSHLGIFSFNPTIIRTLEIGYLSILK